MKKNETVSNFSMEDIEKSLVAHIFELDGYSNEILWGKIVSSLEQIEKSPKEKKPVEGVVNTTWIHKSRFGILNFLRRSSKM